MGKVISTFLNETGIMQTNTIGISIIKGTDYSTELQL
jgi:hypothetical protein